jgi:DNA-binding transcriptional LysR family regulator
LIGGSTQTLHPLVGQDIGVRGKSVEDLAVRRVGACRTLPCQGAIWPRLRHQHPTLRITPRVLRTADQIQALLEQRLHLGFVWEPPEHALLVTHLVGTTGLVAVVPYDHELARRKSIPIAALDAQPIIVWSADMNEWTRDRLTVILQDHDVQPRIVVEAHGFDQQVPHVLAGMSIGLTAASISAAKQLPGLVHIPIRHRGGFVAAYLETRRDPSRGRGNPGSHTAAVALARSWPQGPGRFDRSAIVRTVLRREPNGMDW